MAANPELASAPTTFALCREVRLGPTASSSNGRSSNPIGRSRLLEGRESEAGPENGVGRAKDRRGGRGEAAIAQTRSGNSVAPATTT